MRKLKFPPYEWLKQLPLKHKAEYKDHITGEVFYEEEHCEYSFDLFYTPISVYGRFSYNEDDSGWIFFDVMEGGYCDRNTLGMRCKLNKANYAKICKHAQKVYEDFYRELDRDCSWQWEKENNNGN